MEDKYNPRKLEAAYGRLRHGNAKADAIRYAIEQADLNNDIPYMVFFRQEFCSEAIWYADEISSSYYQIPLEECEKFFDDFTKRWTDAGHSASLPYRYRASFYTETGDSANAARKNRRISLL